MDDHTNEMIASFSAKLIVLCVVEYSTNARNLLLMLYNIHLFYGLFKNIG